MSIIYTHLLCTSHREVNIEYVKIMNGSLERTPPSRRVLYSRDTVNIRFFHLEVSSWRVSHHYVFLCLKERASPPDDRIQKVLVGCGRETTMIMGPSHREMNQFVQPQWDSRPIIMVDASLSSGSYLLVAPHMWSSLSRRTIQDLLKKYSICRRSDREVYRQISKAMTSSNIPFI